LNTTTLQPVKGTYLLIFKANKPFRCRVGKLGQFVARPGFYAYVGSAQGPGGVAARISHHLAIAARPHWHLDYVRPHLHPIEVWCSYASTSREHQWAHALTQFSSAGVPLPGFGASDCRCEAHLAYFDKLPPANRIKTLLLAQPAVTAADNPYYDASGNDHKPPTGMAVERIKLNAVKELALPATGLEQND
jgi:Uri superfamily endonuclease